MRTQVAPECGPGILHFLVYSHYLLTIPSPLSSNIQHSLPPPISQLMTLLSITVEILKKNIQKLTPPHHLPTSIYAHILLFLQMNCLNHHLRPNPTLCIRFHEQLKEVHQISPTPPIFHFHWIFPIRIQTCFTFSYAQEITH